MPGLETLLSICFACYVKTWCQAFRSPAPPEMLNCAREKIGILLREKFGI